MTSRIFQNGVKLNLCKEIIEKNACEISIKISEERRIAKQKLEQDCSQAFRDSAKLIMNSKESINIQNIQLKENISKCSQFEEFKKIMNEFGIKVHDRNNYWQKVIYEVDGDKKDLFFY